MSTPEYVAAVAAQKEKKWAKALKKKLRGIELLKLKGSQDSSGNWIGLDAYQIARIESEAGLLTQLKTAGITDDDIAQQKEDVTKDVRPIAPKPAPTPPSRNRADSDRSRVSKIKETQIAKKSINDAEDCDTIFTIVLTGLYDSETVASATHSLAKLIQTGAQDSTSAEPGKWVSLLNLCRDKADYFWPKDLSKVFWAVGKLWQQLHKQIFGEDLGSTSSSSVSVPIETEIQTSWKEFFTALPLVLTLIGETAAQKADYIDARGVATILYTYASTAMRPTESALLFYSTKLHSLASEMSAQDLANTWWAFAKLRFSRDSDMVQAIVTHTVDSIADFKPQELSMTFWGMATLGCDVDETALEALEAAALPVLHRCSSQSVANIAWASAKIRSSSMIPTTKVSSEDTTPTASPAFVNALVQTIERESKGFTGQGLATAAWACAKLGATKQLLQSILTPSCIQTQMNAHDLGQVAWAMTHVNLKHGTLLNAVSSRAKQLINDLDWQAISHLENLCRTADARSYFYPQVDLRQLGIDAIAKVQAQVAAKSLLASAAMVKLAPWNTTAFNPNGKNSRVLVVNSFTREVTAAIVAQGCKVSRWSRFAGADVIGTSWPPKRKFEASIARIPHMKSACKMMIEAILSSLTDNGSLWICGRTSEGIYSAKSILSQYFESVTVALTLEDVLVVRATRRRPSPFASTLDNYRLDSSVTLDGKSVKWCSYNSGLFANGLVDAMTVSLLAQIPNSEIGDGAAVLDFCCGTGVIARVLTDRSQSAHNNIEIHALDADAVALEATKLNVPSAQIHLSPGFSNLEKGERFDLIVSNPPVHLGVDSDFSVLTDLVNEGPNYLKAGGIMYIVVQAYIPMHSIATKASDSLTEMWSDGKFTVWKYEKNCRKSKKDSGESSKKSKKSKKDSGESSKISKKSKKSRKSSEEADEDEKSAKKKRKKAT
eukprot:m.222486 g.222486  ORF g.222486 m.222486 type:complete len:946 (+) comp33373_c13_seq2:162-2999(+)